jgi:glucose/mannose-6-phosphate isomerase
MSKEDLLRHYRTDASRMLDRVAQLPDQVEQAWRMMKLFRAPAVRGKGALIVCGMGGSAIGGKLLRDMIRQESPLPVVLESTYVLPAFAGKSTPVVCVSYSGNTEEVLSCLQNAIMRGCPTIVLTAGGRLADEADLAGVPIIRLPGGMPPRAALGYLFVPLLALVSKWGFYSISDEEIDLAVRRCRKLVDRHSIVGDAAECRSLQLAKRLYGKTPLIYSGDALLSSAAYRWKCQFNENAKSMAFANNFPELGHNEIMGWEAPERLRGEYFLIVLRDAEDHPRVQRGMEATFGMLEPLASGAVLIESEGERGRSGRLARLLSIILFGDFTSVYLAVEYGKDPTPIERIERIKDELKLEE